MSETTGHLLTPDVGEAGETVRFAITDQATATWAVDKINAARAELARRQAAALAWVEEAQREVARLDARFCSELRAWGLANLPRNKKTIVLRSGKLQYRNKPGRYALIDRARATSWAKRTCRPR